MALRWDLSAVKDGDTVCWIEAPEDIPMHGVKAGEMVMNPITNALIWATISVDLPGITRENVGEFFARLRTIEQTSGAFLIRAEGPDGKRPEGEAAFITVDEVIDHIGLTANVTPLSRTAWLKKLSRDLDGHVERVERRLAENMAAHKD